jgi:hypothetical protein
MALVLGLATGFRSLALRLLGGFARGAALGVLFGLAAFLDLAELGIGQGAGARRMLVLGQRAEHHPGRIARLGRLPSAARAALMLRPGWRRGLGRNRLGRVRAILATDPALAALLDQDLLAAAMGEALAHGAGLDPRLQRQGLAGHAQFLVARRVVISHSVVPIRSSGARTAHRLLLQIVAVSRERR